MPIAAIILICVGCALMVGGFVYLGIKAVALIKAARRAGIKNMADVQEVVGRVRRLEPRFRELEQKQTALVESLERLQAEIETLTYLQQELDRATGHLSSLKSG